MIATQMPNGTRGRRPAKSAAGNHDEEYDFGPTEVPPSITPATRTWPR